MLRFTANLSLLFTELLLPERFEAAKQHGFAAVEIQFPYTLPAEQIRDLLDQHDLQLVLFNVDADDLLQGGEGLAAVPEKRGQFKAAVEQALVYAQRLQPNLINVLPGCCHDLPRLAEYQTTFEENLASAASAFAALGVKTVFEAVNSFDMPHFIIDSSAGMLDVLAKLDQPNLGMQYDIYHMSRMGEDCAEFLRQHLDKIGHIQFADCPGRHQPNTGAIDFDKLFDIIAASGYQGWVGAEYLPKANTVASLDWLKTYAAR
ncbi:MAG: hydroxypyruvate isomerase [Proteobacteria bacterium ST_bin11]|nr:MAG: hydroxypyruvate isomerase [Proteobacteria bacterium ST_bin11]